MMKRAARTKLLAMLVLVGGMAIGSPSQEATGITSSYDGSCIVGDVTFVDDTWGRALSIHCTSGKNYYGYLRIPNTTGNTTCTLADGGARTGAASSTAIDNVKMWHTIAEAGYLSGRTAEISYVPAGATTDCTSNLIAAVGLH